MVVTRRFESRSILAIGTGGQDGPRLTEDRVREIIREEVVLSSDGRYQSCLGLSILL